MRVLIVAATKFEIASSIAFIKKNKIDVLYTGVGSPAALYNITKAVSKLNPTVIIQAGIAGSFYKKVPLAETVAVSTDYFGDLGVMEDKTWKSVFDMGFTAPHKAPYKNGLLQNSNKKLLAICELTLVNAVTINEVTTGKARIDLFKNQGAQIESMEGAALHYVAIMEKIPFLQIRSISNYVGERDKKKWEIVAAVDNLNAALVKILQLIKQ